MAHASLFVAAMTTTRHLAAPCLAVAFALTMTAAGCGGDAPMTSAPLGADGGLDGLAQGEGGATDGGGDDGGGGGDAAGSTLYRRLGGHAGLRSLLDAALRAELADPQIATYFYSQTVTPTPAGHPTLAQLAECMTVLLGSKLGGTESYPALVNEGPTPYFCRNLIPVHMFLNVSGGTFDRFVMIAAAALAAHGVAKADVGAIGDALGGSRGDIVDPVLADAGVLSADAASNL